MGAVVVHHQMQVHFDWELSIQTFQEFKKLLMTMSSKTLPNDFTLSQFQRRKERRGTVALVVMGHGPTAAFFQRQTRLRAIQRLNLTFLVHAEHQCFLWRIQIQTHHVGQFLQKPGITRQLERLYSVRLKTMTLPTPVDRCLAYAMLFGHRPTTPMGGSLRPGLQCGVDNFLNLVYRELRFASTTCRYFPKTVRPLPTEALPPQSNRFRVDLHALGDILVLLVFRCRQYYPTPLCNLLRRAMSAHPALQLPMIGFTYGYLHSVS